LIDSNNIQPRIKGGSLWFDEYVHLDWKDQQNPNNTFRIYNKTTVYMRNRVSNYNSTGDFDNYTFEPYHDTIIYDPIITVENITIKSAGIVIAFITFGGFVEPDEKELDRAATFSKLRVVSAGCLANLVVGLLILLLITGFYAPASGVLITGLTEGGPAYNAGVRQWDVLYAINGTEINGLGGLNNFMSDVKPHDTLILETSSGTKIVEADVSPVNSSRGIMGVRCFNYYPPKLGLISPSSSYHLYLTLDWSFFIIINLSIFNMLPLYPLDGDAYVFSILKAYMKRGAKAARVILSVFSLALLALNIGLTFMQYGLTPI